LFIRQVIGIAALHPSCGYCFASAQAKSFGPGRGKSTRRANQQNLSSPLAKNIPLNPSGKSSL
jgi:hypothetical protein